MYSVSYLATHDDNGACLTFLARDEAEACRAELRRDGCFHVSKVSGGRPETVAARQDREASGAFWAKQG